VGERTSFILIVEEIARHESDGHGKDPLGAAPEAPGSVRSRLTTGISVHPI
jgi:hypothetical protein